MEFIVLTDEEAAAFDSAPALEYIDTEDLCEATGEPHQWEPVWSTNFAGRAFMCETCFDRTD